jgi:hypothetical protein
MRKRRLSIDRIERGPEGERMIVKRPRRDERYEVFVYDFTPERMEDLRAELQAIFDGAEGPEGVSLELEDEDGRAPSGTAAATEDGPGAAEDHAEEHAEADAAGDPAREP